MAGKTELGRAAAKANAETAITDVVRGSARDVTLDYLESKYPGQNFRDLKMRQSGLLTLKDQLDRQVPKLRSLQAGEQGKPMRSKESVSASISEHGVIPRAHGLQRLLPGMGPEKAANLAATKAFKKPGPGRALKPLVQARPKAAAAAASASGGSGGPGGSGPQVIPPPTRGGPKTPRYNYEGPTIEDETEQARRGAPSTSLVKSKREAGTFTRSARPSGFGTGQGVENEPRASDLKAREAAASHKRQLEIAEAGGHEEWAKRVRIAAEKMQRAKAGGTDTAHFTAAMSELFPGKQFHELPPSEMSKVIQRAQQLKEGK
jgi:hypothetical protein